MPHSAPGRRRMSVRTALTALLIALSATGCAAPNADAGTTEHPVPTSPARADVDPPIRLPGIVTNADIDPSADPLARWAAETDAEVVQIPSTADGAAQAALWAPPPGEGRPLIVHVHSWSSRFDQEVGLPIAAWAESVGWGFVQPDFRGINDNPAATGSTLATQDVIDAVDYAIAEGGVDPERVYITGFSGGGMMSLLAAGRHADRFAGVAAWVPVLDLVSWYAYNRDVQPERAYATQIEASCGGDPTADATAQADCVARSPASVMEVLRTAEVPVYLGGGIRDDIVPVVDVLRAFNALADPSDRIPDDVLADVTPEQLPPELDGVPAADTRFTPADPVPLFSRESAAATVVVYDGGHAFVYYPGLDWLARLDARRQL